MRYILPCFLGGAVRDYHHALVEEIATRFDLPFTRARTFPPTSRSVPFRGRRASGPSRRSSRRSPARIARLPSRWGGFGHFDEDVIWVDVTLSAAARALLASLHDALRGLPWPVGAA